MIFQKLALHIMLLLQLAVPQASHFNPVSISIETAQANGSDETTPAIVIVKLDNTNEGPERIENDSLGVAITAPSALAIDEKSGKVLWGKNTDQKRSLASITKLASMTIALNKISDLTKPITIEQGDYSNLGLNVFKPGEVVSTKDALAAALIGSDNTAVHAIVRSLGMTQQEFVATMNAFATEHGLAPTSFADTTGLSAHNVSTAGDILKLAMIAFQNPLLLELTGTNTYRGTTEAGREFTIRSTNLLLNSTLIDVTAGKTGFVTESGYNFVARTAYEGNEILAVVLGSSTNENRFQDYKMLVYWTTRNFQWK